MVEEAEIGSILTLLSQTLKDEILQYYGRCYSYIKDLLAEKNIDLKFKTAYENEKSIKNTVEAMVKTIRLALSTIGVSRKRMAKDEEALASISSKKGANYPEYNSYFENDIRIIIDRILFEIILEYLIDWDTTKIENLDLFDLLPRKFVASLDQFKEKYIISTHIKRVINKILPELDNYINPTNLTVQIEGAKIEAKIEAKPAMVEPPAKKPDLLKELEQAKQMNLEALKESIKQSATIPTVKKEPEVKEAPPLEPVTPPVKEAEISEIKAAPPPPIIPEPKKIEIKKPEPKVETPEEFLDFFGNFPPINPDLISKFNINNLNLIVSRNNNPTFLNLENLFYYIAILKMMNIDIPYSSDEIIYALKDYLQEKVFKIPESKPDPLNMFYGLAILSEFNMLNTDMVDLLSIEMFLESELRNFVPEKLHLNLFTLLSLRLIEKSGGIISDKSNLLNPYLSLNVTGLEEYNPTLDIFETLAIIKMLDRNANLSHFKALYTKELKVLIQGDGSINGTITDSARSLLILDLLDLKKQELQISQKLLKYLVNATSYFAPAKNPDFNWQTDMTAYTVELRMLFWALLASSQYQIL